MTVIVRSDFSGLGPDSPSRPAPIYFLSNFFDGIFRADRWVDNALILKLGRHLEKWNIVLHFWQPIIWQSRDQRTRDSTKSFTKLNLSVRGSLSKKIPVPNELVNFHIEVLSASRFDLMCPPVTVVTTVRPVNHVHLYVTKGTHYRFRLMTSLTIEGRYQEVHFSLEQSTTMSEALSIQH